MAAPQLVNLANMPRDIEGILSKPRAIRFRIAMQLGIASSDNPDGFASMSDPEQAQELQTAMQRHDDPNQPCPCMICTQGQQQQAAPTPAASPALVPIPMAAPMPGAPATPPGAPAFQPPAVHPQQGQQQQPVRQPVTKAEVSAANEAKTSPVTKLLENIQKQQKKILTELESCAGVGETEELKNLMLGMTRMMNLMLVLQLDMAQAFMEVPKEVIMNMANSSIKQGEPEKYLRPDESEGN